MASNTTAGPVATLYRGGLVESRHYGSIAVVDLNGRLLYSHGDAERMTFLRSAAKPFQVLPLFAVGAQNKYDFSLSEIAVMCGSHSGQDMHVEHVKSILAKIGLTEAALQCGLQRPFHRETARRLAAAGKTISPLRNACSGKHACMLAIAQFQGWEIGDYMEIKHPLQQLMLKTIAALTEFPLKNIGIGLDTCGVPVFALPLANMARAYAKLGRKKGATAAEEWGMETIVAAMTTHPELVAGTDRFTTKLIAAAGGALIAKDGGESSFGIGFTEQGLGIALKIEDGSGRALAPTVLQILHQLKLLPPETLTTLASYRELPLRTFGGILAGSVKAEQLF
ncbi:MAG TPA: asparaginase [bacterium]|nr:asparaginase [bacterium]